MFVVAVTVASLLTWLICGSQGVRAVVAIQRDSFLRFRTQRLLGATCVTLKAKGFDGLLGHWSLHPRSSVLPPRSSCSPSRGRPDLPREVPNMVAACVLVIAILAPSSWTPCPFLLLLHLSGCRHNPVCYARQDIFHTDVPCWPIVPCPSLHLPPESPWASAQLSRGYAFAATASSTSWQRRVFLPDAPPEIATRFPATCPGGLAWGTHPK